jgi:hypothetical protein
MICKAQEESINHLYVSYSFTKELWLVFQDLTDGKGK